MPRVLQMILHLSALAGVGFADVPRKEPINKYAGLWTNSPFTSKPPPAELGPAVNPLEDFALAGVSPVTGGYRVTMLNKKNPQERIIVESNKPHKDFQILGVTRKPGDPLGTVVQMRSGTISGNVAFDSALLTLAAPPAAAPPAPPAGQPPIPGQPAPPQPNQPPLRQPRPRVVPPPMPQANAQAQPQGLPPGVQQNQARPERRR